MGHIHDACARWIVTCHHIIPLIIVHFRIAIHQYRKNITTHMRKVSTKERTSVSLKPRHVRHKLMNLPQLVPLQNVSFVDEMNEMRLLMGDIGHWSKSKVLINKRLDYLVIFTKGNMHLYGTLRMAKIIDFLLCLFSNVAEGCRQIIIGHMLESERPKLFVFVGVEFGVVARVLVTTTVAHPHVETFVG